MGIHKKTHIAPEGGWENNSYYVVEVSFFKGNPIHEAILSIGFMNENGDYGNYCYLFNNSYDSEKQNPKNAFYIRVIRKIDMSIQNHYKLCESIDEVYNPELEKKLCNTCKFNDCGCSVQDSLIRIEEMDGREQPTFEDFGCNKHETDKPKLTDNLKSVSEFTKTQGLWGTCISPIRPKGGNIKS